MGRAKATNLENSVVRTESAQLIKALRLYPLAKDMDLDIDLLELVARDDNGVAVCDDTRALFNYIAPSKASASAWSLSQNCLCDVLDYIYDDPQYKDLIPLFIYGVHDYEISNNSQDESLADTIRQIHEERRLYKDNQINFLVNQYDPNLKVPLDNIIEAYDKLKEIRDNLNYDFTDIPVNYSPGFPAEARMQSAYQEAFYLASYSNQNVWDEFNDYKSEQTRVLVLKVLKLMSEHRLKFY